MHDLIRRFAHWLGHLIGPGTGTHRAGDPRPAHLSADPITSLTPAPATGSARLPLHPSPYRPQLPLEGTCSPLTRPGLTAAHDQERARQRHRRVTLVLAADFGIDLDQHILGAGKVAA